MAAVHLQLVHCYIQKGSEEADGITTSPQICCHTTLIAICKWPTIQLYSTVNLVQSDEKRLIMVNVHEGCYFFVFSTRINYVM